MRTPSFIAGPGPGSQILQTLANRWGVGIRPEPTPSPPGIILPPWWDLLMHAENIPHPSPWTGLWTKGEPAGPWAPNALTFMMHTNGGRVAVELDPNDEGMHAAWWVLESHVRLLATSLEGLAEFLDRGPEGLEKLLLEEPDPMRAVKLDDGDLPIDPMTRQWQSQWANPMDVFRLDLPGQGLNLRPGWTRHPGRTLFAQPQAHP